MHIARRWRIKINPTTDIDIAFHDTIASNIPELHLPWLTHVPSLFSQVGEVKIASSQVITYQLSSGCCLHQPGLGERVMNATRQFWKWVPLWRLSTSSPDVGWHSVRFDIIPLCCLSFTPLIISNHYGFRASTWLHWKRVRRSPWIYCVSSGWICW